MKQGHRGNFSTPHTPLPDYEPPVQPNQAAQPNHAGTSKFTGWFKLSGLRSGNTASGMRDDFSSIPTVVPDYIPPVQPTAPKPPKAPKFGRGESAKNAAFAELEMHSNEEFRKVVEEHSTTAQENYADYETSLSDWMNGSDRFESNYVSILNGASRKVQKDFNATQHAVDGVFMTTSAQAKILLSSKETQMLDHAEELVRQYGVNHEVVQDYVALNMSSGMRMAFGHTVWSAMQREAEEAQIPMSDRMIAFSRAKSLLANDQARVAAESGLDAHILKGYKQSVSDFGVSHSQPNYIAEHGFSAGKHGDIARAARVGVESMAWKEIEAVARANGFDAPVVKNSLKYLVTQKSEDVMLLVLTEKFPRKTKEQRISAKQKQEVRAIIDDFINDAPDAKIRAKRQRNTEAYYDDKRDMRSFLKAKEFVEAERAAAKAKGEDISDGEVARKLHAIADPSNDSYPYTQEGEEAFKVVSTLLEGNLRKSAKLPF